MKRIITVLLAVCMMINIAVPSVYAAESGTAGRGIFGFSGEASQEDASTEEGVDESVPAEESAPAKESAYVGTPAEENQKEGVSAEENVDENTSKEERAEESVSAGENADKQSAPQRTMKAEIISEPNVRSRLKAFGKNVKNMLSSQDTDMADVPEITLTGEMPEGAAVKAYPVSVTLPGETVLAAYDITIYDADGEVWQPDESVTVSITDAALKNMSGDLRIFHMEDKDSGAEFVSNTAVEDGAVTFDAQSFSIYVVSDAKPKHTYNFMMKKAGEENWSLHAVVNIEDGQTLQPPQEPYDDQLGQFVSWYTDEALTNPFSFSGQAETVTENSITSLYAKFDGQRQVRFLSLPDKSGDRSTLSVELIQNVEGVYSLDLSTVACPEPDSYLLVGWSTTRPEDANGYGTEISTYYKADDTISVEENMILYPVLRKFHWVYFHGNGGLVPYNGDNVSTVSLRVTEETTYAEIFAMVGTPVRTGYANNDTWYNSAPDENGNFTGDPFTFGNDKLTQDQDFYAAWTPGTDPVKVTIIYWKENVEPDTYSILKTRTENLVPGTLLTLDDYGKGDDLNKYVTNADVKEYFYRAHVTSGDYDTVDISWGAANDASVQVPVEGDGSTVINVWFDRKIYKLTFEYYRGSSTTYSDYSKYSTTETYVRYEEPVENIWPTTASHTYNKLTYYFEGFVLPGNKNAYYKYTNASEKVLATPNQVNPTMVPSNWINTTSANVQSTAFYTNRRYYGTQTVKAYYKYYRSKPKTYPVYHFYQYLDTNGEPAYPFENNAVKTETTAGGSIQLRPVSGYDFDEDRIKNNNNTVSDDMYKDGIKPNNYEYKVYYKLHTYKINLMDGDTRITLAGVKYTTPIDANWVKIGNDKAADVLNAKTAESLVRALYRANGIAEPATYMEFKGWYTDQDFGDDELYDPSGKKMPAGDLTLFARWAPKEISVAIDKNNEFNTKATETVTDPDLGLRAGVIASTVRYLNYTRESGKYRTTEHVGSEFLPADWHTPRYSDNDDALNARYVFMGWLYQDAQGNWEPFDEARTVSGDLVLRAHWQDTTKITVRYWEPDRQTYKQISNLDLSGYIPDAKATAKGYNRANAAGTFRYWYVKGAEETQILPGDEFTVTETASDTNGRYMDLYAYFDENSTGGAELGTYTFKLPGYDNGTLTGEWTDHYVAVLSAGESLSYPPVPTDPSGQGRAFCGWYLDPACTNRFNDFNSAIDAPTDTILYAGFEPVYTVTYYTDSGKATVIGTQTYHAGETISTVGMVYPTDIYHKVDHWYVIGQEDGAHYPYQRVTTETMSAEDLELAPKVVDQHVLVFDSTGGTSVSPVAIPDDRKPAAPTQPTRQHYIFAGWFTEKDGGTEYTFDNTTALPGDGNATLYAHWDVDRSNPPEARLTIAFWAQNAENTGYDAQNAIVLSSLEDYNIRVDETYTVAQVAAMLSKDEAYLKSTDRLEGIQEAERKYFEFNPSDKGTYADGTAPLKVSDTRVTVTDDGKATLNLYFDRVRYTAVFDAGGETITYNNQTYTGTQYSFQAWYGMPLAERWPLLVSDHDGNSEAMITWTNHSSYYFIGWAGGKLDSVTLQAIFSEDMIAKVDANKKITFTLITGTASEYITVQAKYFFDEVENTDFTQKVTTKNKLGLYTFVAKEFTGYNFTSKKLEGEKFKNTYYGTHVSGSNFSNLIVGFVMEDPTNSNSKLWAVDAKNKKFEKVYVVTNSSSPYDVLDGSAKFKGESYSSGADITVEFYYTSNKHDITLADSLNNKLTYNTIPSVPYDSALTGYVTDNRKPTGSQIPDGKRFVGWSTSNKVYSPLASDAKMPDANLTLYAWWEDITTTVTTVGRDKDGQVTESDGAAYAQPYGTILRNFGLAEPVMESGKMLRGWALVEDASETLLDMNAPVKENMSIVPIIRDVSSSGVTYDSNAGINTVTGDVPSDEAQYYSGASAEVRDGSGLKLIDSKGKAYAFVSWNTEANGTGNTYFAGDTAPVPDEGLTLYAQYEGVRETSLVYDLNNGAASKSGSAKFNTSDAGVEIAAASRENGDNIVRITFRDYASLTDEQKAGGGYPNTPHMVGTDNNGNAFTVSWPGYTFKEWNTRSDGTGLSVQPGEKVRADTLGEGENTLYAIWEQITLTVNVYKVQSGEQTLYDTFVFKPEWTSTSIQYGIMTGSSGYGNSMRNYTSEISSENCVYGYAQLADTDVHVAKILKDGRAVVGDDPNVSDADAQYITIPSSAVLNVYYMPTPVTVPVYWVGLNDDGTVTALTEADAQWWGYKQFPTSIDVDVRTTLLRAVPHAEVTDPKWESEYDYGAFWTPVHLPDDNYPKHTLVGYGIGASMGILNIGAEGTSIENIELEAILEPNPGLYVKNTADGIFYGDNETTAAGYYTDPAIYIVYSDGEIIIPAPTGVNLNILPYIFTAIAGAGLFLFFRRRRKVTD